MIHLVSVFFAVYFTLSPMIMPVKIEQTVRVGYAPHYGIGVMEIVARNRKLPIVPCMVSSPYEEIGTWVIVRSDKYNVTKICRVTDVSAPKDKARHRKLHWAVELDWKSAKELCNLRYVGQRSPKACPVIVTTMEK